MGTGKPMELVLGKKFKMEVWETIVKLMSINEVATFTVTKHVSILILILASVNISKPSRSTAELE